MITLLQGVAIVYVMFTASRAILRAIDKKITLMELGFWLAIWCGLIFVVFFPNYVTIIGSFFGIDRGIDLVVYFSIAVLFYLIFRLYVKIDETQRQITVLVRELTLKEKNEKAGRKR